MEETRVIVTAMAAKCGDVVRRSNEVEEDLPKALHPKHLLWMCDQIQKRAEEWPLTRLHRWIGFVQAATLRSVSLHFPQSHSVHAGCFTSPRHYDVPKPLRG